jgi:hypothetical protein
MRAQAPVKIPLLGLGLKWLLLHDDGKTLIYDNGLEKDVQSQRREQSRSLTLHSRKLIQLGGMIAMMRRVSMEERCVSAECDR